VRVLDHPITAEYPSTDDWQFVTGAPAGSQWPAVADAIRPLGRHVSALPIRPQDLALPAV